MVIHLGQKTSIIARSRTMDSVNRNSRDGLGKMSSGEFKPSDGRSKSGH
jgi:hypothetical protein